MDIGEIKKLIKDSSSVLVLDNGEPSFVVLDYKAYKNMTGQKDKKEGEAKEIAINNGAANPSVNGGHSFQEREVEILDRLNKEILALKNQIEMEERGLSSSGLD